jgi:hypothetical protein
MDGSQAKQQIGSQWIDKFGRVRTPRAEYHDDNGVVLYGQDAISAFDRELEEQQKLRQRFAREHPQEWTRYCQAKGYVDAPVVCVPQGHAPRAGTNDHRRGSRRGERSSSSSSDDPDPEPEPRICECGCGAPLEHHRVDARHLNPAHKARAWRAAQAERQLIRDVAQLGPESRSTAPCGCAECARARNGHYTVDPEVLAVWIEQIEDGRDSEQRGLVWPPRLTNGTEPIVVIDADGRRTEFSPSGMAAAIR